MHADAVYVVVCETRRWLGGTPYERFLGYLPADESRRSGYAVCTLDLAAARMSRVRADALASRHAGYYVWAAPAPGSSSPRDYTTASTRVRRLSADELAVLELAGVG